MNNSYIVAADLYDFIVDYRTRPDVSFFVDLAKDSQGPVLELGCGTGRVLIPTARAGVEVVGIDLSRQMLDVCKRKLRDESGEVQSRVRLYQADMRSFGNASDFSDGSQQQEFSRTGAPPENAEGSRLKQRWPGGSQKFALVTIPFRPFQHLIEVEDQLACLAAIHRHLQDDGRLVIDVFNPSLTVLTGDNLGTEWDEGPDFEMPDGRHVVRKVKYIERDFIKQVLSIELIYYVAHLDGRTERLVHAFQMRYFFRYEMEHLLARAGFKVEALYGDYQRHSFSEAHSNDLVFVARKA